GGLVARYYVQKLGGDDRVDTLVTLGTPHAGTRAAHLVPQAAPYPLLTQLRPGSALLRALEEPAPAAQTRFVCFAGDLDRLIVPTASALLRHDDLDTFNIRVPGAGHHALTFNGRVVHAVAAALAGPSAAVFPADAGWICTRSGPSAPPNRVTSPSGRQH